MLTVKQYRTRAMFLLSTFLVVLVLIFMPIYPDLKPGQKADGLTFMDNFFNALSKDSANFIPDEKEKAAAFAGQTFEAGLTYKDAALAQQAALVLGTTGLNVNLESNRIALSGDFGQLLDQALQDADLMYNNNGQALRDKYQGIDEKTAIYAWHNTMGALGKSFEKAGGDKIAMMNATQSLSSKVLEPAYNYYQVERKPVRQNLPLLIFALVFYVVYTCWYGFGILYFFESLGVKLDH